MNSIRQYIYYDLVEAEPKGNDSNIVKRISHNDQWYYELLNKKNIKQIGIQALPGSKFYFNDINYAIIVGNNGYFEIDIETNITITKIFIDDYTRELIKNNPAAMIIIDTIEKEEVI